MISSSAKAISKSYSGSITITEGETKTIYADDYIDGTYSGYGNSKFSASWNSLYTNNCLVILDSDGSNGWVRVLGISPGSTSFTHSRSFNYAGDYYVTCKINVTVKKSSYDKLNITSNIVNKTKVLSGSTLKLTPSVSGSTIYYSTKGNVTPGISSTFPSSGIILNSLTTVKAQAVKSGYPLSDVFEMTYDVAKDDFSATVAGGNTIHFKIISEEDKTCQVVYVPEEATGTLRIPKLINGYNVIAIGEQAISKCKDITNVVIPSTIARIEKSAFECCTGLSSLVLPEGLTEIEEGAFKDCTGLSSLDLPEGLIEIGEGAFKGCTGLTTTNIPATVTTFGKSAFEDCTSLSEIVMATGLTLIGEQAFAGCTAITSLNLPNSLTQLGSYAFNGCTGLTSVTLPSSIENFGTATFKGCTELQTVNVSSGLQDIGVQTFAECVNLTSVNLPTSLQKIGNSVFSGCVGLTSIVIPTGVTDISTSAFKNCSSLREITFPTTLITIESSAFAGCAALNAVSLPSAITSIGESAFNACDGLTSLIIPKAITTVGKNAFVGCSQLKTVTIESNNLVSIDYTSTTSLETVFGEQVEKYILGQQITSIGNYVFYSCDQLTSIVIPTSITAIGNYAFSGCSSLTNVNLSKRITSIGSFAFYGCSGLTSIIIPSSVTAIGNKAFYGCPAMKIITSYITEPYIISDNVFTCYDETVTLFVPYGTSDMYWSVSGWIQFMNIEEMLPVVTNITLPTSQTIYEGRNMILTPTILPVEAQTTLTWTSDNEKIATVDADGKVTGIGEGTTTIRVVTDNGLTASCQIKVIGIIDFADAAIKALCIANWDTDGDGELNKEEAAAVTSLGQVFKGNKDIKSFDELQYFTRVTSFLSWEFGNCSALTSLIIPRGIDIIPSYTFSGCTSLRSVSIPNSVTTISYLAFANCSSLNSLTIPQSTTSISGGAFEGCTDLASIVVESGNTVYDSREECNAIIETESNKLFLGCKNTLIPETVDSIGAEAFSYCAGLVSITIPNNVVYIGVGAFHLCNSLTAIDIPESVKTIDDYAFQCCTSLKSVSISKSVNRIGKYAFSKCDNLSSFTIPDNITNIEEGTFWDNGNMTSITIPDGVETIGNYAFDGCSSLSSVSIPNSIKSIGNSAFEGCESLTAVNINDLDAYCRISFGWYAPLYYAHHLYLNGKEVKGEVSFPNDITFLSTCAFEGCYGITSVIIPEGVTTIGQAAFKNCPNLEAATLPSTLETIVKEAFQDCTHLTSVTIPANVTSIGDYSFDGCNVLNAVTIMTETPLPITSTVFSNRSNATLYVPYGCKAAYAAADYWMDFKEIVEMEPLTDEDTDISLLNNTIYLQKTEGFVGQQLSLSLRMKNVSAIRGFQFDMCLPEGVTVVKNSKGRIQGSLSSGRLPEDDAHTLTISEQENGVIRFLCGSQYDETFTGTDGEIATLTVKIAEDMAEGDYPIILKAMKLTETDINDYYEISYLKSTLTVADYLPGDINGDGKVDVSDYIGVANHIMGNTPEGFNAKAADVDQNGTIDVSDYIGIANLIMTGSIYGRNNVKDIAVGSLQKK